jgi:multisubunit Na+/H+ antiporter MnhB subunit
MIIKLIVVCIVACVAFYLAQSLLPANPFRTAALVLIGLFACLVLLGLAGLLGPAWPGHLY